MSDVRKALIIEDDHPTRKMLAAYLTSLGFECLEAVDIIEGLRTLADNPDVVVAFIDLNLEPFSGYAFLRALGREQKYRHVKCVMVTAQAVKLAVEVAVQDGARGYILKPVNKGQLITCLTDNGFTDLGAKSKSVKSVEEHATSADMEKFKADKVSGSETKVEPQTAVGNDSEEQKSNVVE